MDLPANGVSDRVFNSPLPVDWRRPRSEHFLVSCIAVVSTHPRVVPSSSPKRNNNNGSSLPTNISYYPSATTSPRRSECTVFIRTKRGFQFFSPSFLYKRKFRNFAAFSYWSSPLRFTIITLAVRRTRARSRKTAHNPRGGATQSTTVNRKRRLYGRGETTRAPPLRVIELGYKTRAMSSPHYRNTLYACVVVLAAAAATATSAAAATSLQDCDADMTGFELVTGYVFTAPDDLLDSIPGTLMLTDCLEACHGNDTCYSVNYETGLCVMFSSNADAYPGALSKSQFPVFTIYAQKTCLGVKPCERAWCFDRVQGYKLKGYAKKNQTAASRQDCLELCLGEREFSCRSANYNNGTAECELSDMDRLTVAGQPVFEPANGIDYLENNCVDEPVKLCEFKKFPGRILKTVDSVYQDVGSLDDCRELCLNSPYRCHSYDYGDTGESVCRLSHHSRATLSDIQDPYLEVPEASTYELNSCYNISIECRSGDMVAKIKTSKLFNGKIYAKGNPNSCVQDVRGSLDFELEMAYDDVECNVKQQGLGRYMNDVIIQHHDTIITSSDLGVAITCQYDLTNKTVSNEVDLGIQGDLKPAMTEEVVVDSPNVAMKITDRQGADVKPSAEVGDPLALRFEILDPNSPYEIFVRELVAMDGVDSSEIVLIDADGCPTDHFIMGPLYKSADTGSGKILLSYFDAFKFPSSEVVQFRALVTPCMPTCEPVQCDQEDASGELRSVHSFGKRRRRRSTVQNAAADDARDDMLLVQSIQITDKFGFGAQRAASPPDARPADTMTTTYGGGARYRDYVGGVDGLCVNLFGVVMSCLVFLAVQVAVLIAWAYVWNKKRHADDKYRQQDGMSVSMSIPVGRTDSMCKLYDSGYAAKRY